MPLYNPAGGGGSLLGTKSFDFELDLTTLVVGALTPLRVVSAGGLIRLEALSVIITETATSGGAATLSVGYSSNAEVQILNTAPLADLQITRSIRPATGVINASQIVALENTPAFDLAQNAIFPSVYGSVQKSGGLILGAYGGVVFGLYCRASAAAYTAGKLRFVGIWTPLTDGVTFT